MVTWRYRVLSVLFAIVTILAGLFPTPLSRA